MVRCAYAGTTCDNRCCPHYEPHAYTWQCDQGSTRCGVCEEADYITTVEHGRKVRTGKVDGIREDGGW